MDNTIAGKRSGSNSGDSKSESFNRGTAKDGAGAELEKSSQNASQEELFDLKESTKSAKSARQRSKSQESLPALKPTSAKGSRQRSKSQESLPALKPTSAQVSPSNLRPSSAGGVVSLPAVPGAYDDKKSLIKKSSNRASSVSTLPPVSGASRSGSSHSLSDGSDVGKATRDSKRLSTIHSVPSNQIEAESIFVDDREEEVFETNSSGGEKKYSGVYSSSTPAANRYESKSPNLSRIEASPSSIREADQSSFVDDDAQQANARINTTAAQLFEGALGDDLETKAKNAIETALTWSANQVLHLQRQKEEELADLKDRLENDNKTLSAELDRLNQELHQLKQGLESKYVGLDLHNQKLAELTALLNKKESDLQEKERELKHEKSLNQRNRESQEHLLDEGDKVDKGLEEAKRLNTSLRSDLERLKKELAACQNELEKRGKESEQLKKEKEEAYKTIDGALQREGQLKADKDNLESDLRTLTQEVERFTTNQSEHNKQVDEFNRNIATLELELQKKQSEIARLEGLQVIEKQKHQEELQQLNDAKDTLESELRKAKRLSSTNVNSSFDGNVTLQDQMMAADGGRDFLKRQNSSALHTTTEEQRKEIESLKSQINSLEARLSSVDDAKLTELTQQLAKARTDLELLSDQKSQALVDLDSATNLWNIKQDNYLAELHKLEMGFGEFEIDAEIPVAKKVADNERKNIVLRLQNLQRRLSALRGKFIEKAEQLKQNKLESVHTKQQLDEGKKQQEAFSKALVEKGEELASLNNQNQELTQRIQGLLGTIARSQEASAQNQEDQKKKDQKIADLTKQLEGLQKQKKASDEDIAAKALEIEQLKLSIAENDRRFSKLQSGLDAKAKELDSQKEDFSKRFRELTEETSRQLKDIERLRQESNTKDGRITEQEGALRDKDSEIGELNKKFQALSKEKLVLEGRFSELEESLGKKSEEAESMQSKIAELEKQLADKEKGYQESLLQVGDKNHGVLQALKQELSSIKQEKDNLSHKLDEMVSLTERTTAGLRQQQELELNKANFKAQLNALTAEKEGLARELAAKKERIDSELQQQIQALTERASKSESLQEELESNKSSYEELRKANQGLQEDNRRMQRDLGDANVAKEKAAGVIKQLTDNQTSSVQKYKDLLAQYNTLKARVLELSQPKEDRAVLADAASVSAAPSSLLPSSPKVAKTRNLFARLASGARGVLGIKRVKSDSDIASASNAEPQNAGLEYTAEKRRSSFLEQEKRTIAQQLAEKEGLLGSMGEAHQREIEDLGKRLEAKDAEMSEIVLQHKARYGQIEGEKDFLVEVGRRRGIELENAKAQNKQLENRIAELVQQLQEKASNENSAEGQKSREIALLRQELDSLQLQKDQFDQALAGKGEELERLTQTLSNQGEEFARIQGDLSSKLAALEQEKAERDPLLSETTGQLQKVRVEKEDIANRADILQQRNKALENELAAVRAELGQLKLASKPERADDQSSERSSVSDEASTAANSSKKKKSTVKDLASALLKPFRRSDNAQLRSQIADLKNTIKVLEEQNLDMVRDFEGIIAQQNEELTRHLQHQQNTAAFVEEDVNIRKVRVFNQLRVLSESKNFLSQDEAVVTPYNDDGGAELFDVTDNGRFIGVVLREDGTINVVIKNRQEDDFEEVIDNPQREAEILTALETRLATISNYNIIGAAQLQQDNADLQQMLRQMQEQIDAMPPQSLRPNVQVLNGDGGLYQESSTDNVDDVSSRFGRDGGSAAVFDDNVGLGNASQGLNSQSRRDQSNSTRPVSRPVLVSEASSQASSSDGQHSIAQGQFDALDRAVALVFRYQPNPDGREGGFVMQKADSSFTNITQKELSQNKRYFAKALKSGWEKIKRLVEEERYGGAADLFTNTKILVWNDANWRTLLVRDIDKENNRGRLDYVLLEEIRQKLPHAKDLVEEIANLLTDEEHRKILIDGNLLELNKIEDEGESISAKFNRIINGSGDRLGLKQLVADYNSKVLEPNEFIAITAYGGALNNWDWQQADQDGKTLESYLHFDEFSADKKRLANAQNSTPLNMLSIAIGESPSVRAKEIIAFADSIRPSSSPSVGRKASASASAAVSQLSSRAQSQSSLNSSIA